MKIELDKGEQIIGCIPWPADMTLPMERLDYDVDMVRVIIRKSDGSMREHVVARHILGVTGICFEFAALAHSDMLICAQSRQELPR